MSLIPLPPRDSRSRRALGLTAILSYYKDEREGGEGRKRENERGAEKKKEKKSHISRERLVRGRRAKREGRINETLNAYATRRHAYGMPRLKRLTAKF